MDWSGFAFAVLLIELTPGPNMAWLAMLSATEGRRTGLSAAVGTAIGLTLNGVLAAAGLAYVLSTTPWLFTALRWAGAGLMLWLAVEAWRGAAQYRASDATDTVIRRYLLRGALINLLNPKAFIFYVLIAPPFLAGGRLTFGGALTLTAVSVTIATLVHVAIVLLGDRAHAWIRDPERTRTVRRALAIGLFGVAVWFVVTSAN